MLSSLLQSESSELSLSSPEERSSLSEYSYTGAGHTTGIYLTVEKSGEEGNCGSDSCKLGLFAESRLRPRKGTLTRKGDPAWTQCKGVEFGSDTELMTAP